jgi:hypothetical protein
LTRITSRHGYGRTSYWDTNYDGDLASFRLLNLVRSASYRPSDIAGSMPWSGMIPAIRAPHASASMRRLGCHLVDGAGDWLQQEQPEQVTRLLLQFVRQAAERAGS